MYVNIYVLKMMLYINLKDILMELEKAFIKEDSS